MRLRDVRELGAWPALPGASCAAALDATASLVAHWETGTRKPTPARNEQLARSLRVHPKALLEMPGSPLPRHDVLTVRDEPPTEANYGRKTWKRLDRAGCGLAIVALASGVTLKLHDGQRGDRWFGGTVPNCGGSAIVQWLAGHACRYVLSGEVTGC